MDFIRDMGQALGGLVLFMVFIISGFAYAMGFSMSEQRKDHWWNKGYKEGYKDAKEEVDEEQKKDQ